MQVRNESPNTGGNGSVDNILRSHENKTIRSRNKAAKLLRH